MSGELARLSRTLHRPRSTERLFAMLQITAYCDESIRLHTGILVIAGYMGTLRQWERFDEEWRKYLRKDHLSEFKATDCEHANGDFEGWGDASRRRCCERFVSLIVQSRLVAVATVIDLHAYSPIRPEMEVLRTRPRDDSGGVVKLGDPFYAAFQNQVDVMAGLADSAPPGEKIITIFDLTGAHKGRALMVFDDMKHSENRLWDARLQSASFDDSKEYPGLQAADELAYEVGHYFEAKVHGRKDTPERWQWEQLTSQPIYIWHMDEGGAQTLLNASRIKWGKVQTGERGAASAQKGLMLHIKGMPDQG